jgi:hypothetical protein
MKKLTLELWQKIIDAVYEKSKSFPNMEIGDGTRNNCAEYISFYALNNNLYWSEKDGKICGVATAHPGKTDFSWEWSKPSNVWTAHLVWADNIECHADLLRQFLSSQSAPVKELWTWRKSSLVNLTRAKLKRLFSYGKRQHNNSSATGSKLSRVDEEHSSGSGGHGSSGLRI